MSDPRESLDRGTIVGLKSIDLSKLNTFFPLTKSDPNQDRVSVIGGLAIQQSQAPTIEGQVLIHQYTANSADRLADVYIAVDIDGALEWKPADLSSTTVFA